MHSCDPKQLLLRQNPACVPARPSCTDCRESLWPSALFWPAATTRRIKAETDEPLPVSRHQTGQRNVRFSN